MEAVEEVTLYETGDVIPFDGEDGTYSDPALLEIYFNQGWIDPVDD